VLRRNGDFVVYSKSRRVLYATGTGSGSRLARRSRLVVTNRGDAVLLRGKSRRRLWSGRADVYQLSSNQILRPGQSRHSPNGRYQLAMYPTGNLVLYDQERRLPIWSAQAASPRCFAAMQRDGKLVVYSTSSQVLYATVTSGNPRARLAVQDDGNVVIYSSDGKPLWSSDTDVHRLSNGQLLRLGQSRQSPDGRYRLGMYPSGNLVLDDLDERRALWSSESDGHFGAYAVMQADGNLAVYSKDGAVLYTTATKGDAGTYVDVGQGSAVMQSSDGRQLWSSDTDNHQLSNGQLLTPNQSRRSPNGRYQLGMWPDGNLVLWDHTIGDALWASGTSGHPGAFAAMGADGNFAVLAGLGQPALFQTGTHGDAATRLVVQDNGDVVVYSGAGVPLWSWRK